MTKRKPSSKYQLLFIIPGNPGIGEYYLELKQMILEQWKSRKISGYVEILEYTSFGKTPSERVASIMEEMEDKRIRISKIRNSTIQKIQSEIPTPHNKDNSKSIDRKQKNESKQYNAKAKQATELDVTAIGHSIGGWILQEIMYLDPNSIDKGIFLFPFLALDRNSFRQKWIGFLLKLPLLDRILIAIYRMYLLAPGRFTRNIFELSTVSMSKIAQSITEEYFIDRKHIPRSIFQLAKTEFATLNHELDWQKIIAIQNKSTFFFNANDIWAPLNHYSALQKNLPDGKTILLPEISHDFCVKTKENQIISDALLKFSLDP